MAVFKHGKTGAFSFAATDLSPTLNAVNMARPVDIAETTALQSTQKTFVTGLPDGTFGCTGMFDATIDGIINGVLGVDNSQAWKYMPGGIAAADVQYRQAGGAPPTPGGIITNYADNTPVAGMVGYTLDAHISGAVTRSVAANTFP